MNRRSFLGRVVAGLVAMGAGVRVAKTVHGQPNVWPLPNVVSAPGQSDRMEIGMYDDRLGDLTARRVREHNARIADRYGVTGSDEWPRYEHYFPGPGRKSVFPGIVEYHTKPLT